MISFGPTAEEQAFVETAKSFAVDNIRPEARESEGNYAISESLMNQVTELGFSALELPEEWGGLELPLISQVQILQALSYGDLGIVQGLLGAGDAASLIRLASNHSALQMYKEACQNGQAPSVAFIDAADSEAPWASELTITTNGSGFALEGLSEPVRLAQSAQYVCVMGVDSEGESVILWLREQGWKVEEGDYRLGLLAAGLGRVRFADVHVGAEQVVARGQEASDLISKVQERIRVLQAAKEVGLMEAALDYTVEYTAGRKAFGQEIAKFQGVSFRVAKMAFELQAAHHLVLYAAVQVDEQTEEASGSSLQAIHRAHQSVRFVTDSAVQMLGGHGYIQEFPVEKWMRDAEAQVMLYGREKNYLVRRGEQILNGENEGVAR